MYTARSDFGYGVGRKDGKKKQSPRKLLVPGGRTVCDAQKYSNLKLYTRALIAAAAAAERRRRSN